MDEGLILAIFLMVPIMEPPTSTDIFKMSVRGLTGCKTVPEANCF